ncbi:hypothetical protein ASPWEDRAFT_172650 [Aspergillus wentii DTO 134E9]|uniref:F-box domain-containing protein n=1 Tax=Aspergillus wentii DTO 134E9 TaxID=1073089 RepID=A0A1L9RLR0_ASPWE|nr:uncharacterized protein ASPWEDRAFT_172650 [Aspergillus wentii DTO 134E9]OJJ35861.1 hypothetical protein ASPWEDRAFT_172650 [Aspergillus wentii DTO 134E9]
MPDSSTGVCQRNPTDIFGCLPLELQENIAIHLSVNDVLGLRLASRGLSQLFHSSKFWKSQFEINSQRGFLAHVVERLSEEDRQKLDWRLLFHCTNQLKCSHEFEYSIRIWEISKWLRDTVLSNRTGQPIPQFHGISLHSYHNSVYSTDQTIAVDILPGLAQIAISAYETAGRLHITGLEFIYNDHPVTVVGYTTPGARTVKESDYIKGCLEIAPYLQPTHERSPIRSYYHYPGLRVVLDADAFRGFYFGTLRHAGVCCISVARKDGFYSAIVGQCIPYPNSEDRSLAFNMEMEEVTQFIGRFKDRKLMDMGIRGRRRQRNVKGQLHKVRKSERVRERKR